MRLEDFFELDFFDDELRVLFFALLPREERLELLLRELERPFLEPLLDFFLVAFLIAITILLGGSDGTRLKASCMLLRRRWLSPSR